MAETLKRMTETEKKRIFYFEQALKKVWKEWKRYKKMQGIDDTAFEHKPFKNLESPLDKQ